jgi:arginase
MRDYPTVALIGVPTDIGAGDRGASMGPEALRVAGIAEALTARGLEVVDRGNLFGPLNPWLPPSAGYRHLVHVAIGSITAVARHCRDAGKKLRVLWLDAHADFNTSDVTPSGNVHGMPVACLCGNGPAELTHLGGGAPALDAACIRQIGIRSVDAGEKRLVRDAGLDIYDMRYIDEIGMRRVMEEALDGVDDSTHLHVSFDVDFLDPEIAPGVGTTIPGGPNYREAQLCMEMIADTGRMGSLDIVELNPALDVRNRTAKLCVDLVESLFGKSTLMRE